jgi:hypothetical protein
VWQFFDAMVDAARDKNVNRYLCAAGLLAHYVGDACQPLHGSVLADGFADQPTTVTVHHRDGTDEEKPSHVGAGVHSALMSAVKYLVARERPLREAHREMIAHR